MTMKKVMSALCLLSLLATAAYGQYKTATHGPGGIANVPGVVFSIG